jgi:hypothetical protein
MARPGPAQEGRAFPVIAGFQPGIDLVEHEPGHAGQVEVVGVFQRYSLQVRQFGAVDRRTLIDQRFLGIRHEKARIEAPRR